MSTGIPTTGVRHDGPDAQRAWLKKVLNRIESGEAIKAALYAERMSMSTFYRYERKYRPNAMRRKPT